MVEQSQARRALAAFFAAMIAGVAFVRCNTTRGDSTTTTAISSGASADAGPVRWPEPQAADAGGDSSAALADGAECARDEDCVPASCCHATACVAIANRPACEGMMCTMDCRPGTMDCGGGCACRAGRCAANLNGAPAPIAIDAGVASDASAQDAAPDAARRPRRR